MGRQNPPSLKSDRSPSSRINERDKPLLGGENAEEVSGKNVWGSVQSSREEGRISRQNFIYNQPL